jgi:hypothetical protein
MRLLRAVRIEHRGWERLGAVAEERRDRNRRGWAGVTGHYRRAAGQGSASAIVSVIASPASMPTRRRTSALTRLREAFRLRGQVGASLRRR